MEAQGQGGTTQVHVLRRRTTSRELGTRGARADYPRPTLSDALPLDMDASCDPLTPVFSALSPKTSPSSHAGPLLPVPGRPVARARIASDPCDARASHVLARQDESTVAPHRRRTRTILGDRDPVPQQEEAVSQFSAERDRRLPKTRPPYYVKSSATSSEYDWDDDTLDVDVQKSLDASGCDFVVPGADLRESSFAEPPRAREDSVPRRNTLRFDADADAALESFASSKRAISPNLAGDSITSERSEEEPFSPAEAARDAKRGGEGRGTRGSRASASVYPPPGGASPCASFA